MSSERSENKKKKDKKLVSNKKYDFRDFNYKKDVSSITRAILGQGNRNVPRRQRCAQLKEQESSRNVSKTAYSNKKQFKISLNSS